MSKKNTWALITGASSGLGAEFARQLAAQGYNLVITARRTDRLEQIQRELTAQYSIQVQVIGLDLMAPQAAQTLFQKVQALNLEIDIIINNAGLGSFGNFSHLPNPKNTVMLSTNVNVLVELTWLFLQPMLKRGFGRILQISSVLAYAPTPSYAVYAASKVFVLHFSEALQYELRGTGVTCTAVCPGATATEFLEVTGQKVSGLQKLFMMKSPEVVRVALRSLHAGERTVIPGLTYKIMALALPRLPRWLALHLVAFSMRGRL